MTSVLVVDRNNVVVNKIVVGAESPWRPPEGHRLVPLDPGQRAEIGWIYDAESGALADPSPPTSVIELEPQGPTLEEDVAVLKAALIARGAISAEDIAAARRAQESTRPAGAV